MENKISNTKKTVAFFTLGCKLNFAETAMIARKFTERGYLKVAFTHQADIYIINTCSVTQVADKKCRNVIKRAIGKRAKVVVMGCYSQLKPEEIAAIEGVDLVIGTKEKFNVIDLLENLISGANSKIITSDIGCIENYDASYSTSDRTRAFLKIQDGCDYNCSYCTIPLARGKSRNENIIQTVDKAKQIANTGIKEIVITGVNIGDFGQSTGETFFELIKQFDNINGIERFRISSIEPNLITNEIIEYISQSKKFVPHFHIPLQSGCNKILGLMRRRYNRELYLEKVNQIKKSIPNACIGVDVIIGFPGESKEDFLDTYEFIKNIDISYLHVFPFSARPNTPAAEYKDKISTSDKEKRSALLIELSEQKRIHFYKNNLGDIRKVLFESRINNGLMTGFTDNYIKVEVPANKDLFGKVQLVELINFTKSGNIEGKILVKS